ncbi:DUF6167 family protein [Nocardioides insulae]|uniref:DUF6167 family protein n=1 Tax=Nocardioides insulae TaxID=394734 RepID=UPI000426E2F9|nr:DUF6167 family protein [Nocardioides insulae]
MSRALWFAAGAGAGIYAMIRGRRAAESVSPNGLRDRLQALGVGARMLREEIAVGSAEKEHELRERLALRPDPRVDRQLAARAHPDHDTSPITPLAGDTRSTGHQLEQEGTD